MTSGTLVYQFSKKGAMQIASMERSKTAQYTTNTKYFWCKRKRLILEKAMGVHSGATAQKRANKSNPFKPTMTGANTDACFSGSIIPPPRTIECRFSV